MAQFLRPTSILTAGGWTGAYTDIDEATANDGDFISSPSAPSNAEVIIGMGSVTDPASSSGHILRVRMRKNLGGGSSIAVTPRLFQTNTEIYAPGAQSNLGETFSTFAFTLTTAAADSITDYTALRVRLSANQT